MTKVTETKYVVTCGSGVAPNPEFDTYPEAIARFEAECSIPSYMGAGHKRQVAIHRRTIVVEDMTPTRRRFRIEYDDPATGERKTHEGVYHGTPAMTVQESVEDHAYALADKAMGTVEITELPL